MYVSRISHKFQQFHTDCDITTCNRTI